MLRISDAAPLSLTHPAVDCVVTSQRGESLWGISQRHGVSVEELKAANVRALAGGSSDDLIYPGQQLLVPYMAAARRPPPAAAAAGNGVAAAAASRAAAPASKLPLPSSAAPPRQGLTRRPIFSST